MTTTYYTELEKKINSVDETLQSDTVLATLSTTKIQELARANPNDTYLSAPWARFGQTDTVNIANTTYNGLDATKLLWIAGIPIVRQGSPLDTNIPFPVMDGHNIVVTIQNYFETTNANTKYFLVNQPAI